MQIGPVQVPSVAVLAPMAGMTDVVFRLLCRGHGCGLVYTELVKADCLLRGLVRSLRQVETTPAERPVGVQLYHDDPDTLAEAARLVTATVPCDLIDLNMGCPVPKVVSRGAGAALMRDPRRVERLVRAVVDATDLPVTAKTRSGWDDGDLNAVEVARAVEAGGGVAIAVHARTRTQRHEGPVDQRLLAEVVRSVSIPVIGNGGIVDAEGALRMRRQTGVQAVMVGRGSFGNPWIFGEIDAAWRGLPHRPPSVAERLATLERHVRACTGSIERWAVRRRDRDAAEIKAVRWVRGHVVGYVRGAPGERALIRKLNDLETIDQLLEAVREAWLPPGADAAGPTLSTGTSCAGTSRPPTARPRPAG